MRYEKGDKFVMNGDIEKTVISVREDLGGYFVLTGWSVGEMDVRFIPFDAAPPKPVPVPEPEPGVMYEGRGLSNAGVRYIGTADRRLQCLNGGAPIAYIPKVHVRVSN